MARESGVGVAGSRDGPPYLRTLGNGLSLLTILVHQGPMSLRELAAASGMNRSVTYRLLYTLIEHGFARRSDTSDIYSVGIRVWELGIEAQNHVGFRGIIGHQVRRISHESGETAHLAVLDGLEVVYIDKVDGSHAITSYSKLGGRSPAFCVATGKALLATLPDAMLLPLLTGLGEEYTPNTFTSAEAFMVEIARIRADGFAVNRGEWRLGVSGVAIAIRTPAANESLSIGFSGPSTRIEGKIEELKELLLSAREQIFQ